MELLKHGRKAFALIFVAAALVGCKTEQVSQQNTRIFDKSSLPPAAYYVHCETCNWCKGPFKKTQDAERVSRDHNIQKHDYIRVAYYDAIKCKR
jgi:hypothetical protein